MLSSWLHRIAADCTLLFPSRAVLLQRVPNLCVMGGDAHAIVRSHLRPCSVSHVFINFPEPPSGYQVIALQLPCNRPPCNCPAPRAALGLPGNCPATALQPPSLQLPWNRPSCNCPGTALPATALEPPSLQLPWNRPATALHPEPPSSYQLPWNRPATALQLPCNCPRAIRLNFVRLPRISRLSHCRLRVIARGLCAPERLGHC